MVVLGIVCIGLGILIMVARDFFWSVTELSNSFAGRQSERTELWETGQIISGLVLIGIGAFVICAGAAQDREREERRVAPTQTAVAMEAYGQTLQARFGDFLPGWLEAGEGLHEVRPGSIGINAEALYYGRCDNGAFFLAVRQLDNRYGEDYVYMPDGDLRDCHVDGLRMYALVGGDSQWKRANIFADAVPTPTATLSPTRTLSTTATPRQ